MLKSLARFVYKVYLHWRMSIGYDLWRTAEPNTLARRLGRMIYPYKLY